MVTQIISEMNACRFQRLQTSAVRPVRLADDIFRKSEKNKHVHSRAPIITDFHQTVSVQMLMHPNALDI